MVNLLPDRIGETVLYEAMELQGNTQSMAHLGWKQIHITPSFIHICSLVQSTYHRKPEKYPLSCKNADFWGHPSAILEAIQVQFLFLQALPLPAQIRGTLQYLVRTCHSQKTTGPRKWAGLVGEQEYDAPWKVNSRGGRHTGRAIGAVHSGNCR